MNDLRERLKKEFTNREYRYAYAESFLNTKIAAQIRALREQRGKTQSELSELVGTKQSGFSRYEDVSHSVWKTDTLWKIARALGVRLNVSFETFGALIDEKIAFSRSNLERPCFEDDPYFSRTSAKGDVPISASLSHQASGAGYVRQLPKEQECLVRKPTGAQGAFLPRSQAI